ncbi:MAG: hypothetical protein ACYS1A_13450 [Planctomycetota bacterium]|jgi:hypothetical protein
MDSNHCQIVQSSLNGERTVDEQTFSSLTILSERLEHLKNTSESFSAVTFSSAVKKLAKNEIPVGV